MSAPLTFQHALDQAEAQARSTLDVALHERLRCAVSLVKDGRVFQQTDGTWQVDSTGPEGLTVSVNGTCRCQDARYNKPAYCKHRLAMFLAQRVQTLMSQPAEAVQDDHYHGEPTPPALPEAPASANVRVTIAGREVQLTLRDHDEARLLERLAKVLTRFPVEPQPQASSQPQGSEQGWCSLHNVQMRQTTKEGRSWYSHRTAEGWCKGR